MCLGVFESVWRKNCVFGCVLNAYDSVSVCFECVCKKKLCFWVYLNVFGCLEEKKCDWVCLEEKIVFGCVWMCV